MILRDKPGLLQLLFALRGSVLSHIWPRIRGVIVIAAALVALDLYVHTLTTPAPPPSRCSGWRFRCSSGFAKTPPMTAGGRREIVQRLTLAFIHHHRPQLRGLPAPKAARDWVEADFATAPLPYVYSLLVFRATYLYCLLVPLALLEPAGWMTPAFVAVIAYVFFGLVEVTEELANPFGETVNGLPLDAMCRTIEISIAPHLGVEPPERLRPKTYYLSRAGSDRLRDPTEARGAAPRAPRDIFEQKKARGRSTPRSDWWDRCNPRPGAM